VSRGDWIEAVARRDRAVALAGLAALTLLAWLYLSRLGREMADMAAMGMAPAGPWTAGDVLLATGMWAVMMVAMMLPGAAPMILVFATVNRKRRTSGEAAAAPYVRIGVFVTGYLVVWSFFSVAAALAQWGLQRAALLSEDAMRAGPVAGALILLAAGTYQLTPLKYACLARCQTPLGFLLSEWREGARGTLVMGLRHGLFCLGCCWALMALLFVGGVMNLGWVAAIAGLVLVEKLVPSGRVVSWLSGGALLAWGIWTLHYVF
jgi:predicted metal-binding membrane protein